MYKRQGTKSIYIKDENELESYLIKNSKDIKKYKKNSKEFNNILQIEKSKLNIQRDNGNIRAFSSKELEGFKLERAKRGRSLPQGYKRVLSITVERPESTSN